MLWLVETESMFKDSLCKVGLPSPPCLSNFKDACIFLSVDWKNHFNKSHSQAWCSKTINPL